MKVIFAKQLKQLQTKPRKICGFNGIWTYDLRDTGALRPVLSISELLFLSQTEWKEVNFCEARCEHSELIYAYTFHLTVTE